MSIVQFNYRIAAELVPKTVIPKGAPLKRETPGGKPEKPGGRNKKGRKGEKGEETESVAPQPKKQLYWIKGGRKLMPFYEHGYNKTGGDPDPNSKRQERLHRAKNGPPDGLPKTKPYPPTKAPGQQVKENFYPSIVGEKDLCSRWTKSPNIKGWSRIMFSVDHPPPPGKWSSKPFVKP